jgi:type IV secretory pathway VirB2 component (pilin)
MSRRKPLSALAAVAVALGVAVPSASAATTATPTVDPLVCQLMNVSMGPFGPTQGVGGASLASVLTSAGATVGCSVAAPAPSLLPTYP